MELRVLVAKSKGDAMKVLNEDWAKRTGATLRENLDGSGRVFVVVKASEETVKRFLDTGVFEVPEDEEGLVKIVKEEEERSAAGVGLLGF